ncbi:MAG: enoyl-CoA hydratase/isomerase family protein [Acidimicrobiia bacterium]
MSADYSQFAPALLVEKEGPLRILTMNYPESMNSFQDPLHRAMRDVWNVLMDDEEAKAVVVTGAGKAFSAGGHIPNFIRNYHEYYYRRRDIRYAERLWKGMIACEIPMVAAVNGPAVGLGASIAVHCDLVVMNEDTYMSDPHVSIGLVAGDGGAVSWPLYMGLLRAKEYILLGDRIPAAECKNLGLANRVVPADQVLSTAKELAMRLANQPPQALRDTKRALNLHLQAAADLVLGFALSAELESFSTEELKALAESFVKKENR